MHVFPGDVESFHLGFLVVGQRILEILKFNFRFERNFGVIELEPSGKYLRPLVILDPSPVKPPGGAIWRRIGHYEGYVVPIVQRLQIPQCGVSLTT